MKTLTLTVRDLAISECVFTDPYTTLRAFRAGDLDVKLILDEPAMRQHVTTQLEALLLAQVHARQ